MENRISYIHLTDLHIGQKGSNAIFSQTKEIIKEDTAGHLVPADFQLFII